MNALWVSIGHMIFFRKRLAGWVHRMSSYLGQIGCQGDGVSRQGTQVIYDSYWEAAKFDDACKVPTPCLLLSDRTNMTTKQSFKCSHSSICYICIPLQM